MTNSPHFITHDRVLVEAVQAACKRYGIDLTTWSDDWFMRLHRNGQSHFICVYSFDCNTEAAARMAADKVVTFEVLRRAEIAAVPHFVVATEFQGGLDVSRLQDLFSQYGTLVLKPLRGARGVDVARFDEPSAAQAHIGAAAESDWAASPYLEIQREVRLVVFDGVVRLAYAKTSPQIVDGLKLFNASQGASALSLDVTELAPQMAPMAINAMAAMNLQFGAVDVVQDAVGQWRVLEINTGFTLEYFALINAQNRAGAIAFYDLVIRTQFEL